MGPACVHRLRNRPPGVARGHIRIPEECSSTDCVTEHDGRWSWPPRSWLVGFCLTLVFALVAYFFLICLLFDMYAIARGSSASATRRSLRCTATLCAAALSLHAFVEQPSSLVRAAPRVSKHCVMHYRAAVMDACVMRKKRDQLPSVLLDASWGFAIS